MFEGNALNAGNYSLLYSNQLGYDFATASSITITPAPLTVTANDFSKFYDGATYSGFMNGETNAVLGGSLVYVGNSQGAVSPGLYGITPSGLSSSNYNLTYVDGTLQIKPRSLAEATPGYTGAVNSGSYYNSGQTSAFNNPQYGFINACAPRDAYVRLSDQHFALTEVSSFELDGNGTLALTDEVNVESIASNELTVTMLNGSTRYPDNRTGIARRVNQIMIVKLPSIVLLEGVK